ncbi:class I SAM-dependent methyltransferase [Chloroflexota bacterium]
MSKKYTPPEPDLEAYLRYLKETDPLREQTNLDIIATLNLSIGSIGLDVGCGMGTQALMLAGVVGPQGHVTGLDIRPEFLDYARQVTAQKGMSDRVTFDNGDLNQLPYDNNTFDWVWSSDCIGYIPPTKQVTRVIKPGGSLNIAFWSSEYLLPGYPQLEAKLRMTTVGLAPFSLDSKPEDHHLRSLSKLKAVGLTNLKVMTFNCSVHAPLSPEIYQAMVDIIEMRWPNVEPELSKDDYELYKRLTDPDSSDYILKLPDYYGFYTYSVFRGWVPDSQRS